MKTTWALGVGVAVAIAAAAAVFVISRNTPAPDSTFILLDGSQRTTTDFKGKVTLVNFWATSCVTCVGELSLIHI